MYNPQSASPQARLWSSFLIALGFALALYSPSAAAQHIVIDPGHGGNDPGGVGTGMQEKDIVLDTSQRFRDLLNADSLDERGGGSWTVSMTRDTDVFITLAGRSQFANDVGAARFFSIHANAFGNTSANGTETFSGSDTSTAGKLRNLVQEEMVSAWGLTDRGAKTANFSVLRNTAMPAVLHELGFITNSTDAVKLGDPNARQDAARAHLFALQRHYDLEPYAPNADPDGAGIVEVRVLGAGLPLASVAVTIGGEDVGLTDDSGVLRLTNISPGERVVGVSASGFQSLDEVALVEANRTTNLSFFLLPATAGEQPGAPDNGDRCDVSGAGGGCPDGGALGGCNTGGGTPSALFLLFALAFWALSKRTRVFGA